jgi:hypothetical protein
MGRLFGGTGDAAKVSNLERSAPTKVGAGSPQVCSLHEESTARAISGLTTAAADWWGCGDMICFSL